MPRQDLIQRYEEAYKRYENRIKSWTKKFHAVVKQIPKVKFTKNISEKSIERLEKQKWSQYSERKKKEARKEYEIQYENRMPTVYKPKPVYTPPTEQDYFNNPDYGDDYDREWEEQHPGWDEPDEDGYTETVDSRAEIEAWIDRNIYAVTVEKENEGAKEKLERLVIEAADQYGDDASYYTHLENNAARLNQLAEQVIKYHRKGSYGYQEELVALTEFATILNLGRPLSPRESERLENEGWVGFDFND